ncbi:MAG: hypothetical protein ACP5G7_02320 [Anaerolineae bacterium]
MASHLPPTQGDRRVADRKPLVRETLIGASMGALCGCTLDSLTDREPLSPALGARLDRDRIVRTTFDPTVQGWRLVNRFPIFHRGRHAYGLCGGLCYAALDYWKAGLAPPPYETAEKLPPSLRRFLWRRQLTSMAPRHLAQLAAWALRSDQAAAAKLATVVAPQLCAAIEVGRPTPVMLVRIRGLRAPWDNHQAVICGYRWSQVSATLTFEAYDPNHPGHPVEIGMDLSNATAARGLAQSTGEPLRGLFPLHYQRARPPAGRPPT